MAEIKTWRNFWVLSRRLLFLLVVYVAVINVVRFVAPPPDAVGIKNASQVATGLQIYHDDSWIDRNGHRQLSQAVFDAIFAEIRDAQHFIVLDMFLFNAWQGPVPEQHRRLSNELTNELIARKKQKPGIKLIVISDPINTVYGGMVSPHFVKLREADAVIALTDLTALQDSNSIWSSMWRFVIKPFGNGVGYILPNPFGEGRVSVRSYLTLLNFKANHRKLLITDNSAGELVGFVSSANPHDGSSAHRNSALKFSGPAVHDLLNSERALLAMSGADDALSAMDEILKLSSQLASSSSAVPVENAALSPTIQIVSESRIFDAAIETLGSAYNGDTIDLSMFYLSSRKIVQSLKAAAERGARVRVLLDVNNDAFGRRKNGVPNRPVAAELMKSGVAVRWCETLGEQCHSKWLHVKTSSQHHFLMGSANFTRRNLNDLNMETDVLLRLPLQNITALKMISNFEAQWNNRPGRIYSAPYEKYAKDSLLLTLQYRFMELTGISTF